MKTMDEQTANDLYPTPLIRGERIARLGEKDLGRHMLNAATGIKLGTENTGWLITGLRSFERMVDHIKRLNQAATGGRWIVVPATNLLAELAFEQWFDSESGLNPLGSPTLWHEQLVSFCVPEQLDKLLSIVQMETSAIAGLILLDPQCFVHRGRSYVRGHRRMVHDRPQMIVDFRAACAMGDWQPPFIQMTCKPAGAVSTNDVARIFCLDSFHCIDGNSLACGFKRGSEAGGNCDNQRFDSSMLIAM